MKKIYALVVLATALAGCGDTTPVQTVDWYKQHNIERKAMIADCDANPGQTQLAPNCTNAKQAEKEKANARRGWLNPSTSSAANKGS